MTDCIEIPRGWERTRNVYTKLKQGNNENGNNTAMVRQVSSEPLSRDSDNRFLTIERKGTKLGEDSFNRSARGGNGLEAVDGHCSKAGSRDEVQVSLLRLGVIPNAVGVTICSSKSEPSFSSV